MSDAENAGSAEWYQYAHTPSAVVTGKDLLLIHQRLDKLEKQMRLLLSADEIFKRQSERITAVEEALFRLNNEHHSRITAIEEYLGFDTVRGSNDFAGYERFRRDDQKP